MTPAASSIFGRKKNAQFFAKNDSLPPSHEKINFLEKFLAAALSSPLQVWSGTDGHLRNVRTCIYKMPQGDIVLWALFPLPLVLLRKNVGISFIWIKVFNSTWILLFKTVLKNNLCTYQRSMALHLEHTIDNCPVDREWMLWKLVYDYLSRKVFRIVSWWLENVLKAVLIFCHSLEL